MSFSKVPTTHISGYKKLSSDGSGNITGAANSTEYVMVPLATLSGLDSSEANGSTGDIRKIWKGFCDLMVAGYNAMALSDRPKKLHISSLSIPTGTNTVRTIYTIAIDQTVSASDVSDES